MRTSASHKVYKKLSRTATSTVHLALIYIRLQRSLHTNVHARSIFFPRHQTQQFFPPSPFCDMKRGNKKYLKKTTLRVALIDAEARRLPPDQENQELAQSCWLIRGCRRLSLSLKMSPRSSGPAPCRINR